MLKSAFTKDKLEAGCDEAGRGCLAGPVVAAAVIFDRKYSHSLLNDSKQLNKSERLELEKEIKASAVAYALGEVWNNEIDKVNILNASFMAMHRAIDALDRMPELLLIDGNRFKPYEDIAFECIVKGDGKYASIAAASILAKTHRDKIMENLGKQFPAYGWHRNVGYPTIHHRQAIRENGITKYHRRSFKLLPNQLELFG